MKSEVERREYCPLLTGRINLEHDLLPDVRRQMKDERPVLMIALLLKERFKDCSLILPNCAHHLIATVPRSTSPKPYLHCSEMVLIVHRWS